MKHHQLLYVYKMNVRGDRRGGRGRRRGWKCTARRGRREEKEGREGEREGWERRVIPFMSFGLCVSIFIVIKHGNVTNHSRLSGEYTNESVSIFIIK